MKRLGPVLLLAVCAALVAGAFYLLLEERAESGDVYPVSSSLRSDPMGTMALFESLHGLPGVKVTRDTGYENKLPEGRRTTYLHLAAQSYDWDWVPPEEFQTIDHFLLQGGRLVIVLSPEYARGEEKERDPKKDEEKKKEKEKVKRENEKEAKDEGLVDLKKRWGLEFERKRGDGQERQCAGIAGRTAMAWACDSERPGCLVGHTLSE